MTPQAEALYHAPTHPTIAAEAHAGPRAPVAAAQHFHRNLIGQQKPLRRQHDPSLAPLVDDARAGCPRAFEEIYRLLAGHVASYLRWHRASDPDGLTNDVFVQVHRNLRTFEGDDHGFRSWLFTIAHHRMIDDRRQASRQVAAHGDDALDENQGGGDVEEEAFAAITAFAAWLFLGPALLLIGGFFFLPAGAIPQIQNNLVGPLANELLQLRRDLPRLTLAKGWHSNVRRLTVNHLGYQGRILEDLAGQGHCYRSPLRGFDNR